MATLTISLVHNAISVSTERTFDQTTLLKVLTLKKAQYVEQGIIDDTATNAQVADRIVNEMVHRLRQEVTILAKRGAAKTASDSEGGVTI